jgi:hypothetical protein
VEARDIELERGRSFERKAACSSQKTIVVSAADPFVPVSYPAGLHAQFDDFEVQLEGGTTVETHLEFGLAAMDGKPKINGLNWTTYRLPLPSGVPLGYHTMTIASRRQAGVRAHLIVCPDKAYLPESLAHGGRTAGFNVSLYGLRSERNWGCGDFTDLRALIDWAAREIGFSFIGLNPLHALHNRVPVQYQSLSSAFDLLQEPDLHRCRARSGVLASRCAQQLFASPRGPEQASRSACFAIRRI